MASMNLVQLEARNNTGAILLALIFILPLNELAEPLKMNWGLWLRSIWLIRIILEISSALIISVLSFPIMHPIIHWRLIESSLI